MGVKRAQAARQAGPLIWGLNPQPGPELARSCPVGEVGIPGVAVECADIGRNTDGEGSLLGLKTDAEVRKRGERTGLDTLVVHAVNDEYQVSGPKKVSVPKQTH